MIINIPNNRRTKWRGVFPSKYVGDFQQAFNMDLERVPGRLSLSGVCNIVADSNIGSSFSIPKKFLVHNADGTSRFWAITGNYLLHTAGTNPTAAYTADTITGSPGGIQEIQDAIIHGDSDLSDTDEGDRLIVALETNLAILHKLGALHAWDTDWWTAVDSDSGLGQTALKSGDHSLARLQKLTVVGDQGAIHTIDKDDVVNYNRLTFRVGFSEVCIYTGPNRFWIALKHDRETNGAIIEWDGFSGTFNREYPFLGTPISGFIAKGVPYFINNFGQIMKLTGSDFEEVARFPIFEENLRFATSGGVTNTIGKYACEVDGDIVKIFAGRPIFSRRMRSGVWHYNLNNNNLYHHRSFGQHNDSDTAVTDYGQGHMFRTGGLKIVKSLISGTTESEVIVGGAHYVSYTGTTRVAIYEGLKNINTASFTTRGYFVTPRIPAGAIQDTWNKLVVIFKKFVHTDNRIIVKFRAGEEINPALVSATSTWVSDTHFTAIVPIGVVVGDEIEVLAGQNGGLLSHITALNDTDGTATTPNGSTNLDISVNEAAPSGSTNGSLIVFDNWRLIQNFADSDSGFGYHEFIIPSEDSDGSIISNGQSIEFKIELRGRVMEVDRLLVELDEHFKAKR